MRNSSSFMSIMLAYGLMHELTNSATMKYENFASKDNTPNIRTYGSKSIRYVPKDEMKKSQGRNELCSCGSGKKFKKCCSLRMNDTL